MCKPILGQDSIWSNYVEENLIPRLNGFEILMASYAMAHLKLDMLFSETGYKPTKEQRFRIYLTNSLEEHHPDTGTLWANWLSTEANEANHIKRDTPVMVVLGNPPYNGESSNKGKWILDLITPYKKEYNGEKLKEKNSKWLNNDYVKFIRLSEYLINKTSEGILAFITSNSYLDSPIFRGMRFTLLNSFKKIYIIDLHGSSKRNVNDQNVFDITEGVSIIIGVKYNKKSNELAELYHLDITGERQLKYNLLLQNRLNELQFIKLNLLAPNFYFIPKDFSNRSELNSDFSLPELFKSNSLGYLTKKDHFIIGFSKNEIIQRLSTFFEKDLNDTELAKKFGLKLIDKDKWNLTKARNNLLKENIKNEYFRLTDYRCFDKRYVYYNSDFVARLNKRVLSNLDNKDNYSIISVRQLAGESFYHIFISNTISEQCYISNKTKEGCIVYPLYIYDQSNSQLEIIDKSKRTPNLTSSIVEQLAEKIGLVFIPEKEETYNTFAPIDILDYIYAILHCPKYRKKYKEFLKVDYPRVPYPKDKETFWQLVKLGGELRQIHLLESPIVEKRITTYPQTGQNLVSKLSFENDKVWINDTQYFEGVPQIAWDFYIGGYQPAQKWLKDRKGRELSFEDILHYQKIIVALVETDRIMKEIDKIEIE